MVALKGAKLEALAIKALVSAVESSKTSDEGAFSCRDLCNLFEPAKRSDALVSGYTIKQQQTLLWNALKNGSTDKSNKNQLKRFFSSLQSIVEQITEEEAFVPESVKERENHGQSTDATTDEDDVTPDKRSDEFLLVLKCAALAVRAFLDGRILRQKEKEKQLNRRVALKVPPHVFQIASSLHEILFPLHSCGSPAGAAKTAILSLCEFWWLSEAEYRESLIAQCLPLLVLNASDERIDAFTTKSHIQRLYKLRNAFSCIDFDDPCSDSLRQLLLRVASNPVCLQLPEGRKFLSGLLQQDVNLVEDLHRAFRAQIPEAKESILKAYGEIYHRAWKEAYENHEADDVLEEGEEDITSIRETIEHDVLQDLMYSVVNMESPSTFRSILTVLDPIHADKKNGDIGSLLYRLYSPILWRSLAATNPRTRKNAVVVLEKVFPLQDPTNSLSMKEAVLKATGALQAALKDVDPAVRVAASKATARTCLMFWEILPSQEIRYLLNQIVVEHSSDSKSADVRAAALDSVSTLLGTTKSHAVLRALLPSLGNLIHDKTERVRLAATRMLHRVKQCPGIRFYHVVPVDHLMARLVAEERLHTSPRNAIARELTALLLSSYFPQSRDLSANQLLQRTISFLITDPDAASVFYANLVDQIEVESLVKFTIMLFTCLKNCVDEDQAKQVKASTKMKKRRRGSTEHESSVTNEETSGLTATNTSLMVSLSTTINVLWDSLVPILDKPKNKAYKMTLEDRFACDNTLVDIIGHFERKGLESQVPEDNEDSSKNHCFCICSSMLDCAARLEHSSTDELVSFVTSSLHSLANDDSKKIIPLVTSYVSFLCRLKFESEVAEALARSIDLQEVNDVSVFSPDFHEELGVRRSSRRSSTSTRNWKEDAIPCLSTSISWGVLEYTLQGVTSQGRAIRRSILHSKCATRTIERALEKGIKLSERLLADDAIARTFGNDEVEYAIKASEAYGRFALHKESSLVIEKDDSTSMDHQVGKLLLWTTKKIIPAFMRQDDEGASALRDCDLSHISNRLSMSIENIPPGSPSLMSPPKQKPNCGRTPEAMRGHSSLFLTTPTDSPVIYSAKVGAALLLSSCILSSEMLAMGMTNADEISKAAVQWSQIFDQSKWHIDDQLLNAFIRLAIQLFRSSGDSTLLEDLLVKCDCNFKDTSLGTSMKKELQLLLRMRNGIENLVPSFFNVSSRIINSTNDSVHFENVGSLADVWDKGGSIQVFLDAIRGNHDATYSFARAIVKQMSGNDGDVTNVVNFNAKCLSLVLEEVGGSAETQLMSELNVDHYEKESGMRMLVENLLECSA